MGTLPLCQFLANLGNQSNGPRFARHHALGRTQTYCQTSPEAWYVWRHSASPRRLRLCLVRHVELYLSLQRMVVGLVLLHLQSVLGYYATHELHLPHDPQTSN